jgi:uncharacterized protein YjaG (DUF416 family)
MMNRLLRNPSDVVAELRGVDSRRRAAFAAACAERLFPAYARFKARVDDGSLRAILDRVWELTEAGSVDALEISRLIQEAEGLAPDTANTESPFTPLSVFVSAALNATSAVLAALECFRSEDATSCGDAARMSTATVYLALPASSLASADHPLLRRELVWQGEDIALVKSRQPLSELRARAAQRGTELVRDLDRLLMDG